MSIGMRGFEEFNIPDFIGVANLYYHTYYDFNLINVMFYAENEYLPLPIIIFEYHPLFRFPAKTNFSGKNAAFLLADKVM